MLQAAKHAGDGAEEIITFSDADFADNVETLRSTSASIVIYRGCPIAWRSQTQRLRTHSTTHAEMVAACDSIDLLKSQGFLHWFHDLWDCDPEDSDANPYQLLPPVMVDNQSCIAIGNAEGGVTKTSKHLRLRAAKLNDWRRALTFCDSSSNLADMLTKPLTALHYLGLFRSPSIGGRNFAHARLSSGSSPNGCTSSSYSSSYYNSRSRYNDFDGAGFYPLVHL